MFKPDPKPVKKETDNRISKAEFNRRYGRKLKKQNARPKKATYSKLVGEADDWFSRRVRLEAADNNGLANCVTCNTFKEAKYMDCGHFYSREDKATRWDTNNTRIQCKGCNGKMGRPEINEAFKTALIKSGVNVEMLNIKRNNLFKPTQFELELIINENKALVKDLLNQKGIEKWW